MLRSSSVATTLTGSFEWVCLDQQHGEHDDRSVQEVAALCPGNVRLDVRVRANDAGLIGRALDLGASGVIVPLVETVEEAAAAVAACKYPPTGTRSWGPIGGVYGRDVPGVGAAAPTCFVMIETALALDAVEAIAAVDGLDGIFVGPVDLAISLGTDLDALLSDGVTLQRILRACRRADIVASVFAGTPARGTELVRMGFDEVIVTSDSAALQLGLQDALAGVSVANR